MTPEALAARSVTVMREHQDGSGAFIAAPSPPQYRNAWLRDGSFVAEALSRAGETASAEAFFSWCAGVVEARADRLEACEILHGRYTLAGREVPGHWSAEQLDGYGSWVWALGQHAQRHGVDPAPWIVAAELSLRYAAACWSRPCFDWWEETWGVHVATLAALYGGLTAAIVGERWAPEAAGSIREAVSERGVMDGRVAARLDEGGLDASLLAVAAPFGLLEPDDPLLRRTVEEIEATLVHGGGVHRYLADSYYGGGLWVLLACLLGWHYVRTGRLAEARAQLDWVARVASPDGDLPEQTDGHLLDPPERERWLARWGPPASPLLWSHAMFVILALELGVEIGRTHRE